jgi:Na+/H+-translocating membrane pyrophosphatase
MDQNGVNLLSPIVFASLMFGAMVPYWFSAMTMKSVGLAANAMVKEVARQWAEIPGTKVQILACFAGTKVQILTLRQAPCSPERGCWPRLAHA